jgi:hypothetical protein
MGGLEAFMSTPQAEDLVRRRTRRDRKMIRSVKFHGFRVLAECYLLEEGLAVPGDRAPHLIAPDARTYKLAR